MEKDEYADNTNVEHRSLPLNRLHSYVLSLTVLAATLGLSTGFILMRPLNGWMQISVGLSYLLVSAAGWYVVRVYSGIHEAVCDGADQSSSGGGGCW